MVTTSRAGPPAGYRPDKYVGGMVPLAYSTEASLIFAAFTTPPSVARKALINRFVKALISAGVWTKMDVLYILAAADSQAARINWISPGSLTASAVNSPTFTTDRGYAGDAATSYLDTGYNVSTATLLKQNDNHFAIYPTTNVASDAFFDAGTSQFSIDSRQSGGQIKSRNSSSTSDGGTTIVGNGIGHIVCTRSGSASYDKYRNGAILDAAIARTSAAPANTNVFIGGFSTAGVLGSPSSRRIGALHAGSQLSAQNIADFYTAIHAYMVAVGADI